MLGFYSHYRGRSVGRILGCLEHYCGLQVAEIATVGNGTVDCWGPFAAYTWDGDSDTPTFVFLQDKHGEHAKAQEIMKPLLEERHTINVTYVMQEISKQKMTDDEQILALMQKHVITWDRATCERHLPHFKAMAAKYWIYQ